MTLRSAGSIRTIDVPLKPTIRLVDRGAQPVRRAALWDAEQHDVLMTFDGAVTRPILDDRRSYILAVERGDGSEVKLKLRAGAATVSGPLMVVVR